ncbi:MAG: hypothetical protein AB1791_06030 [Chloroflexota bacterium]
MVLEKISPEFTLRIPDEFRWILAPNQEVAINNDAQGRLIITPMEQIRAALLETFGMWADRTDLPGDGVAYVDEVRHGFRLDEVERRLDEDN